jgi:zinc D-Ala-D-Ala carboxypeptidase
MSMKRINDFSLTVNFALREFQCSCCNQVKLYPQLVKKLQDLRDHLKKPIIITSGYRCPVGNKKARGVANSYHLQGMAADIKVPGMSPEEVAQGAAVLGFGGIGLYSGFVHLDIREGKARW